MKTIGIIGLGKFGYHIAEALSKLEDVVVIAVDRDEKIVQEISEHIENAFVLDSTDAHALEEVGMFELDTVIISIGEDLEASILTVMAVKSLKNKHIIAKAMNPVHGQILSKLGAFEVIYPEKIAAKRLVKKIIGDVTVSEIDISNNIKVFKMLATKALIGKSVTQIEETYPRLKLIAIKHLDTWTIKMEPTCVIDEDDSLAFIGDRNDIKAINYKKEV
ncbi:MAG: TrkA family potassium uptake protein [Sulfurovum sp.]|nr:MAG: TrkA family potassium uptake protein [Sulfurovum sp.]